MKQNLRLQVLLAVLSAGLMFSSCGNIDIVKRKYRPGFHVDISKKQKRTEPVEETAVAEQRTVETFQKVELAQPTAQVQTETESDQTITASAAPVSASHLNVVSDARKNVRETIRSEEYKEMNFSERMKSIEKEVFRSAPVANLEWMKWVSFGTGIGSLVFGALAFLFAVLTAVFFTGFVWGAAVLAILLGAAAITFSLIYKKNNGAASQSRLGFIFGIVGAGLGVLAIILGAIFFTIFILA